MFIKLINIRTYIYRGIGNGFSDSSSNPGQDCLHFTWDG